MSVIFSYRPVSELTEFYESFQGIQDTFGNNDGFGKLIFAQNHYQTYKNVSSKRDYASAVLEEARAQKCLSNSSLPENDVEYYRRSSFCVHHDDNKNVPSSSSIASFPSYSSDLSNANAGVASTTTSNTAKTKSKRNYHKKKNSGEIDYRKKYKTEMCKYWAEKGFCEFGDTCAFAHSNQEIRQKSHVSANYKTKKCNSFHEQGYCPYGVRCQFVHSLRKDCHLNPSLLRTSYVEFMENPDLWMAHDPDCICMQKDHRNRLSSFEKFSSLSSIDEDADNN